MGELLLLHCQRSGEATEVHQTRFVSTGISASVVSFVARSGTPALENYSVLLRCLPHSRKLTIG